MAVPFTQLVASTYDAVVNERNKAANQWAESAFLNALDAAGGIKRHAGGSTLDMTLDYRANPDADFLATDVTATGVNKTDVLTQASYAYATLVVPTNWTFTDEVLNSSANQKVDLLSSIVDNAIATHDDMIEVGAFASVATDGFLSLPVIATSDGTGTVGSIIAGTETWWENQHSTFTNDTDIEAGMTTLFNLCAKGSGAKLQPEIIVSNAASNALYESNLQAFQRYEGGKVGNGGFKSLKFKDADVVFSKNGTDDMYFINPTNFKLYVVQGAFRQRRTPVEFTNAAMMNMKIFSVLQFATNNRSRLGKLVKS